MAPKIADWPRPVKVSSVRTVRKTGAIPAKRFRQSLVLKCGTVRILRVTFDKYPYISQPNPFTLTQLI